MHRTPNHRTAAAFVAIFLFLSAICLPFLNAAELALPKTVTTGENIKIVLNITDPSQNLEITVSSRSLKVPMIVPVGKAGEVDLGKMSAGNYLVGLRQVGAKKYLDMGSFKVVEVLR